MTPSVARAPERKAREVPEGMRSLLDELGERRAAALAMGGRERVRRHHETGRLTVRERIDALLDAGSWYELGLLALPERRPDENAPCDAIVTGLGSVDGRKVCLVAIDATVMAGTTAPVNMRKQNRLGELAGRKGMPLIFLSDADGGRMPDVLGWRFSGLPFDFRTFLQSPPGCPPVPRITASLGPSFGDAALHAAMAHFVVMTETAALALSGPPVIAGAIGEQVTPEELGGPDVAAGQNGMAHMVVPDEEGAFAAIRRFLSYLPSSGALPAPEASAAEPARDPEELLRLVPTEPRRAYDVRKVVEAIVDEGSVFPWSERFGRSLVTCLARLEGRPVGIVASQTMYRAGVLDDAALAKGRTFVDMCDTFNVPLVFLHDVPGLMIGTQAERAGILRAYELMVARLARVSVPKVSVVLRKSYGGGHFAMGGRPTHPDFMVCWPTAELGFMAPETGTRTVYRKRLEEALAEGGEEARDELHRKLAEEWAGESEPWEAAAHIHVDDVIDPRDTRRVLTNLIEYAWGSRPRVASKED